jgi:toxin YhaV
MSLSGQSSNSPSKTRLTTRRIPKRGYWLQCTRPLRNLFRPNPDHPDFRLGKTLGLEYTNWRRVKKGMPDRYRLFFRFASSPVRLIVYVWFNDQDTLRKAGSRTDVYEVFKRMLARGDVPSSMIDLSNASSRL